MRVCEINSCRSALLGVDRNDERQTFFDKHAGGEGKTLGNNKFTRILLLIVFVKNTDIFFSAQRTPDLEQTKRHFQFRLFF